MIMDKLKLNESKTEFMIIGTRQQLSKINRNTLLVGSNKFESMTYYITKTSIFAKSYKMQSNVWRSLSN